MIMILLDWEGYAQHARICGVLPTLLMQHTFVRVHITTAAQSKENNRNKLNQVVSVFHLPSLESILCSREASIYRCKTSSMSGVFVRALYKIGDGPFLIGCMYVCLAT